MGQQRDDWAPFKLSQVISCHLTNWSMVYLQRKRSRCVESMIGGDQLVGGRGGGRGQGRGTGKGKKEGESSK